MPFTTDGATLLGESRDIVLTQLGARFRGSEVHPMDYMELVGPSCVLLFDDYACHFLHQVVTQREYEPLLRERCLVEGF